VSPPAADETPLPVAYCAPGRHDAAALVLALKGETVSEIREHPYLEGYDGILVCTPPDEKPIPWPATYTGPSMVMPLPIASPSPLAVLTGLA
jgi:hypothetical protein